MLATLYGGTDSTSRYVLIRSTDGLGEQWGPQTFLLQGPSTGYTGVVALGGNEILVAYDNAAATYDGNSGEINDTYVDLLNIQRLPAIVVSPTDGLTTTRSGGTAQFTFALRSQPEAYVTLGIFSDDPSEGSVSPAALTFTAENWDVPQQVTVAGQDDLEADGNETYSITMGPAVSADPAFNGATCSNISVTNVDDVSCVWTGAGARSSAPRRDRRLRSSCPWPAPVCLAYKAEEQVHMETAPGRLPGFSSYRRQAMPPCRAPAKALREQSTKSWRRRIQRQGATTPPAPT